MNLALLITALCVPTAAFLLFLWLCWKSGAGEGETED